MRCPHWIVCAVLTRRPAGQAVLPRGDVRCVVPPSKHSNGNGCLGGTNKFSPCPLAPGPITSHLQVLKMLDDERHMALRSRTLLLNLPECSGCWCGQTGSTDDLPVYLVARCLSARAAATVSARMPSGAGVLRQCQPPPFTP